MFSQLMLRKQFSQETNRNRLKMQTDQSTKWKMKASFEVEEKATGNFATLSAQRN